jgi:hypothetical protein
MLYVFVKWTVRGIYTILLFKINKLKNTPDPKPRTNPGRSVTG